jgi:hypothetical protein
LALPAAACPPLAPRPQQRLVDYCCSQRSMPGGCSGNGSVRRSRPRCAVRRWRLARNCRRVPPPPQQARSSRLFNSKRFEPACAFFDGHPELVLTIQEVLYRQRIIRDCKVCTDLALPQGDPRRARWCGRASRRARAAAAAPPMAQAAAPDAASAPNEQSVAAVCVTRASRRHRRPWHRSGRAGSLAS